MHQVSRTVVHACDNIEDFITKRSSAGADGAGIKSTEKREVEKRKICDTEEEKRAAGTVGAGKNPSLKNQSLKKVKCNPNL